jgi:hypothetical protein
MKHKIKRRDRKQTQNAGIKRVTNLEGSKFTGNVF